MLAVSRSWETCAVLFRIRKSVNCKRITFRIMSTVELRKKLIEKIQKTENSELLEEAYRLLDVGTEDMEIYKFSDEQRSAVAEGRQQIKDGKFLTEDEANREIDEWLGK